MSAFDPKRTVQTSPKSGDNSKGNRNFQTIWRRILPRHRLHLVSNPLLNFGALSKNNGRYPHEAPQCEIPELVNSFERMCERYVINPNNFKVRSTQNRSELVWV